MGENVSRGEHLHACMYVCMYGVDYVVVQQVEKLAEAGSYEDALSLCAMCKVRGRLWQVTPPSRLKD